MTEHITIILITYGNSPERTEYAVRTVDAIGKYLRYPNWSWYVSDDGSQSDHLDRVMQAVERTDHPLIGYHSERISYGSGYNRACQVAFESGGIIFPLEDDWELSREFDLYRYAALLMERPDVGMTRFGYINAGLSATLFGHNGSLYWMLNDLQSREYSVFSFAGHPSLIHRRLIDLIGPSPEKLQPGDWELGQCWNVSSRYGPKIVWPAELGERGPFDAVGTVQSYSWDGGSGAEYVR